jgi:hypothetical protein
VKEKTKAAGKRRSPWQSRSERKTRAAGKRRSQKSLRVAAYLVVLPDTNHPATERFQMRGVLWGGNRQFICTLEFAS